MTEPTPPLLDLTETPCAKCEEVSTENEEMIGCDGCQRWFHNRCVIVPADAKKGAKWYCEEEACQKRKNKYRSKKGGKDKGDDDSSVKSDRTASLQEKLKAMEEKQKQMEQELELEMKIKMKEMEINRAIELKRMLLEKQFRDAEEEKNREMQEAILQERQDQLDRMEQQQKTFADKMKAMDKAMERLKESTSKKAVDAGEGTSGMPKVEKLTKENLEKLEEIQEENDDFDHDGDNGSESQSEDESGDGSEDESDGVSDKSEKIKKTKVSKKSENLSQHGQGQVRTGPTKTQLAARNGVSKKLPIFSGKPEEWPLFFGMYQASNEACGYSDIENLVRLQECLKGQALEMVRGQLLLPKSVPRVIEKLRQLYGRPEQLLQSHLEKVHKLEPPKAGKLASFIPFGTAVEQLCEHLEAAELKQHLINPLLIQELVEKLPDNDKREWVRFKRGKKKVTLRTFTDFLSEIVSEACEANVSMEFKPTGKANIENRAGKIQSKPKEKGAVYNHSEAENKASSGERRELKPCKVCQRTDHRLRYCQDFKNLSYADRMKVVDRWKLCHVCLNEHGSAPCKFKLKCNVGDCRQPHNSLLHPIDGAMGTSAHIRTNNVTLFRMIPVSLHCGEKSITVLAFLDEGASVTLGESGLADRLGVAGVHEKLTIKWTADIARVEKDSKRMNLWVSGVGADEKMLLKTVRTVERLMLPQQALDAGDLARQFKHMRGLPIASYNGRPEMLIGLNNIHSFAPLEAKIGAVVDPIAVRCKLGWTVYGPKEANAAEAGGGFLGFHHEVTNDDLHKLLKTHYALEESIISIPLESAEDKRARDILEKTTKRCGDRFETGLLWKTDDPVFPDSYPMALRRLKQLEKKLEKKPELHANVCKQIDEYQEKGYAHLATPEELEAAEPGKTWFLPLNVVLNPKKPGKVRLIWDAAAMVLGISLNSQLLKGPDMLVSLVSVIAGFREKRIAVGGDLREMFHQMKIIARDRKFQQFLFRKDPKEPPRVYVMDVATFGSTSSPCSAQYVKNLNAQEYAGQYPDAAEAIIKRHYVDDYFDSVDTVEEAIKRAKEVRLVHQKGGFEIRNWVSNSPEVLKSLGEQKPVSAVHITEDKETSHERVLGLIWDPELDEFSFSTQHRQEHLPYLSGEMRPTKRAVLSCVMGFFDPLGYLSPYTIHGRIIVQHLWRSGCDWDEAINDECWEMWMRWIAVLPEVENIRIPRCYLGDAVSSAVESTEVHIFSDASEHAYGCVAYLRMVINGVVRCTLAMSRSKVAPLKRQSIPRLELMAAVLGARMSQTMIEAHSLKIDRCVLWTDSRTVWSWIRSDQHKYKQFVAFRIGEILELTKATDWRWVPTKQNVADILTKWHRSSDLERDGVWYTGPSFLHEPDNEWPNPEVPIEETREEVRGHVSFHGVVDVDRASRWTTLQRVMAYVVRFVDNCKRKVAGHPILTVKATANQQRRILTPIHSEHRPLERDEFRRAQIILWKQAQFEAFPDEMSDLAKNLKQRPGEHPATVRKCSSLYKLTPFLDEDGVLRYGGRLEMAENLPYDKRFPIILPRKHATTEKLIQSYHERFGHANRETVMNELRQRYWIPNARTAIRQTTEKCVWCKVYRCQPHVPRMAPHSTHRVTPYQRPFSSVGIDYLGPIEVTVGRRKEKRWVAVFTCLAVRAVHLEVVPSLTTQSCLMAIRRFSCKRGVSQDIFSDNGTCFVGADNEMKRIYKDCAASVTDSITAWHFNPPAAPHMGGIWERMVRSVKEAMKALDNGRTLSDEVLQTTLAEAEDMINSRPLTYVPQESAEEESITPNHFLRGSVTPADLVVHPVDSAEALRDAYKYSQELANHMWERWLKEYLPTINRRSKWFEEQKPLQVDDLVFIVEGKNRKSWVRGVVQELLPGPDGRVRQVLVRTTTKVYRRAVANLAVIEIK